MSAADNSILANCEYMARAPQDSRRYLFALELKAGSRTEYLWDASKVDYLKKAEDGEMEPMRQTFAIRKAILGGTAKENEANVVHVEVNDPGMDKVSFPLVHLMQGRVPQASVDVTFPELPDLKVKFTLEGSGPVHLIGYHFVERLGGDDPDYGSEAEEADEDVTEEEIIELENQTGQPARISVKRRLGETNGEEKSKKLKVGAEKNGNGNGAAIDEEMKEAEPEASVEK